MYSEQAVIQQTPDQLKEAQTYNFKAQQSLNELFDKKMSNYYREARNTIYPEAANGSYENLNRAGDKLEEILQISQISINNLKYIADVCSIPGSWTIYLQKKNPQIKSLLLSKKILGGQDYYDQIKTNENCVIIKGEDDGNVYMQESLKQYRVQLNNLTETNKQLDNQYKNIPVLDLYLADGGFQITSHNNLHVEHLQETITQRLLLCQIFYGLQAIKVEGSMLIKCFDLNTNFSINLLYLVSSLFENLTIIKTKHSRITNSERYLLFKKLKDEQQQINEVLQILSKLFVNYKDDDYCFKSILTQDQQTNDQYKRFENKLCEINQIIMNNQSISLKKVVDLAWQISKNH